jgi:hypothetical protein
MWLCRTNPSIMASPNLLYFLLLGSSLLKDLWEPVCPPREMRNVRDVVFPSHSILVARTFLVFQPDSVIGTLIYHGRNFSSFDRIMVLGSVHDGDGPFLLLLTAVLPFDEGHDSAL